MFDMFEVFKNDVINTIEGLIGITPEIDIIDKNIEEIKELITFSDINEFAIINFNIIDDNNTLYHELLIPSKMCSALTDLMLAGDGEELDNIDDEILDGIKEIISNILGSFSTGASSIYNKEIDYKITDTKIIKNNQELYDYLKNKNQIKMFNLRLKLNNSSREYYFYYFYDKIINDASDINNDITSDTTDTLDNIELNIEVRIADKSININELNKLNINDKIKFNKKYYDKLELYVNDKLYAYGEAVIVDGNFGIQITELYKGQIC